MAHALGLAAWIVLAPLYLRDALRRERSKDSAPMPNGRAAEPRTNERRSDV